MDCNVSWIYNTLFSLSKLHSSTVLRTSPFFGKKCTLPHFLKNKKNSNSHPFRKVGEIQLRLIKTTCFTYLLLILIQQYENTSGYGTGGYMLQKKRIGRWVGFFFFFHFLVIVFFFFLLYTKSI